MIHNFTDLEYHSRITPSIQPEVSTTTPREYTIGRVVRAFLPLIALNGSVGMALELVGGTYSLYDVAVSNEKNIAIKALKITFHVTSVGLLLINPLAVSLAQNGWEVVIRTHDLGKCLLNSDFRQASICAFTITEKCVFIAAIVVGGPNIILISMIAQTGLEIYRVRQFQTKEMYLEAAIQVVVVGTRCHGIYKHIDANKEHFQDLYGKIQRKFNAIINECMNILKDSSNDPLMQIINFNQEPAATVLKLYEDTVQLETSVKFNVYSSLTKDYKGSFFCATFIDGKCLYTSQVETSWWTKERRRQQVDGICKDRNLSKNSVVDFVEFHSNSPPLPLLFSSAWCFNNGGLAIDRQGATNIKIDRLRDWRRDILQDLDIAFIRALEIGSDSQEAKRIVSLKQELRDFPKDPNLAKLGIDELAKYIPDCFKRDHYKDMDLPQVHWANFCT